MKIIGKGSQRICYEHPDDARMCIKVALAGAKAGRMQRSEVAYLQSISSPHVYRHHGRVMTDEGEGEVFDLVRDFTGELSLELNDFIFSFPERAAEVLEELEALRRHLVKERIITHDLNSHNILCRSDADGSIRLVLIDGIGDPARLSFLKNLGPLFKISFERRWRRLVYRLRRNHPWMWEDV